MSKEAMGVLQDLENEFQRQVHEHEARKYTGNAFNAAFHQGCERAFSQAADMVMDRMSRVSKEGK